MLSCGAWLTLPYLPFIVKMPLVGRPEGIMLCVVLRCNLPYAGSGVVGIDWLHFLP